MSRRRVRFTIVALTLLVGCVGAPPQSSGHLVIIGGALEREHGAVHQRVLAHAGDDARLAILPTASGVPGESGPSWATAFDQWAGRPVADVMSLSVDQAAAAADENIAAELAAHRALFFTGGDQSRIVAVFRPDSGDTPCYRAVLDVLAADGVVAGSSAGAAMMSDPMIRGGSSAGALHAGARFDAEEDGDGVWIGKGMGLFPFGIVDQHFLARGRLGRLLVALAATGTRFGFGVEENCAIDVDLATGTVVTIGSQALLLVDTVDMRRNGRGFGGARFALLGNGDTVDGRSGVATIAPHKRLLVPTAPERIIDLEADPWRSPALIDAIARLGRGEARAIRMRSTGYVVALRTLESTRFYADAHPGPESVTVVGLGLDVLEDAEQMPDSR